MPQRQPLEGAKHIGHDAAPATVVIWLAASDCTDAALYPDRNSRASRRIAAHVPQRLAPDRWSLPSSNPSGARYTITRRGQCWTCTCRDRAFGHTCKHIRAVVMTLVEATWDLHFDALADSQMMRDFFSLALLLEPDDVAAAQEVAT